MVKKEKEQTTIWCIFFNKYFLIGLLLMFLSVIYDIGIKILLNNYQFWQTILNIIFSIIYILGPSLVVASIFTFSIESKNFIKYIIDKIEKTMIKKEFLDKLNDGDKREALKKILTPSDEKYQLFSNIKNYFEETITKSMTLFDCSFKSHFTIDVNAIIKDNKVCCNETMCHRIYKSKNGFDPIKFSIDDSVPNLVFDYVQYTPQNERTKILAEADFKKTTNDEETGVKWITYLYDIPKDIKADFISVIYKLLTYGYDHWLLYSYKTEIPSEGINVIVNCSNELIIKEFGILDNGKNYNCYCSEDKKRLEIYTSQWISPGHGFFVLIAKE